MMLKDLKMIMELKGVGIAKLVANAMLMRIVLIMMQ